MNALGGALNYCCWVKNRELFFYCLFAACGLAQNAKPQAARRTQDRRTCMKALCHREGLLAACQLASVAVATRDVKPVLKSLKAIVEPDRCTLMATDLELGIRLEVRSVQVEEAGEAILPGAKMISIRREPTDEALTI